MSESKLHLELRTALYQILKRELASRACIGSEQFIYWNAKDPRRCLAPDAFVKLGARDEAFTTWKTWERGTPELAVEVLSDHEDWEDRLDRYHELRVRDAWSFLGRRRGGWQPRAAAHTRRGRARFFWLTPTEIEAQGRDAERMGRVAAEKRVAELEKQLRRKRRR